MKNLKARSQEAQHLEEIFDTAVVPMIITDGQLDEPGPRILYVNKSFQQMCGYSQEELLGKTPRIFQGERSDRQMLDRLKETLKKGEPFSGKTVNYKKDGTPYNVEWTITPIKDDSGKVISFYSIQKDITSEIKVQQQYEQIFYEQSRLAAMGEMIDSIAHQFKQPLGVIRLKAQGLELDYELDPDNVGSAITSAKEGIENQVDHMTDTIDEFRGFFQTNKSSQSVFLSDIITSVQKLLHDDLIKYQIQTKLDDAQKTKVNLYPNDFKHALINIINNSKEAFEEKNIKDRHIWLRVKENDSEVTLEIKDNAGGIPQDILERIFDPKVTTKKDKGGSGRGMFLTKQIIDKADAAINASNTSDGACFTIKVPK